MRLLANVVEGWFGSRSLENPATPLSDPAAWLVDLLGGGKSSSGIDVNRESALCYSPVWRAVNLISRDVAKLPLVTYKRTGDDGKDRALRHPVYRLLRYQASDIQTAFQFKMMIQAHALLNGAGFAYIMRDGAGNAAGLVPLNPETTYPLQILGNTTDLFYMTRAAMVERVVPARDVLHIRGLSFDIWNTYSVIDKAKDSIGLGLAQQSYRAKFFANGAVPSVVLEHPGHLTKKAGDNLRDSWQKAYGGNENKWKAAILEEGMKLNAFSVNAKDAQLVESAQFQPRDVANWFGIPPHKVGDATRTSYSSLEQENQAYLDDALDGWLVNWEDECRQKLLTADQKQRDTHVIEFNRAALVRADMKSRTEAYNIAINGGWMSRDEVRAKENMPPIPDGEGAVFLQPLNMKPVGEDDPEPEPERLPEPEPEEEEEEEEERPNREPIRALLVDTLVRFSRRIVEDGNRAASRGSAPYWEWATERLPAKYSAAFMDAWAAPAEVARAAGLSVPANEIACREWIGCSARLYLAFAECKGSELAAFVTEHASEAVANAAREYVDGIIDGVQTNAA